jgi:hypothetical protein
MKKRALVTIFAILTLLGAGLFLFRTLNPNPAMPAESGFREWLWGTRQFDLIVQALLVFGGALGIAAILPFEGADE